MKRKIIIGLSLLLSCLSNLSIVQAKETCTNHSILIPRGLTTNQTLELGLGNYEFYRTINDCDAPIFELQASYFHLKSRKSADLARYFLPNGKTSIVVTENGSGDIGSLYFNLIAPSTTEVFSETFSICPTRKVDGGYFNLYFNFAPWHPCFQGCWAEIAFAAAQVKHTIYPKDSDVTIESAFVNYPNFTAALNNTQWTAGKFSTCRVTETGVDDVMLKFGRNWFWCENNHVNLYIAGIIPTGKRTDAYYAFEPIIGSNHGRIGFGTNSQYVLRETNTYAVTWMNDLRYLYGLEACERRSFDLTANGAWSRYLPTTSPTAGLQPGINNFTYLVQVTPRSQVDFWTALHADWCNWNFEFSYNLFWRQKERICFPQTIGGVTGFEQYYPVDTRSMGFGIYDISGATQSNAVSASQANISQTVPAAAVDGNVAPSDTTFVYETFGLLNKQSGAAPTALSSTLSAAIAYQRTVCCRPFMFGAGGLYEFSHKKGTIEQWGWYLKASLGY